MDKPKLRLAITILTAITTLVHLALNWNSLQIAFLLNAIGYAVLLVLFQKWLNLSFLAGRETLIWYVYLAFTAVTIVAYFAVRGGGSFANPVGLITKVDELLLLGSLWLHKANTAA